MAWDDVGGKVKNVTCPVCGRAFTPKERSVDCDEPRCPMKSKASALKLLAIEVGVPVGEDGASTNGNRVLISR
jgi:hypothetical protein